MQRPDKWDEIEKELLALWGCGEFGKGTGHIRDALRDAEKAGMARAGLELIAAWNDDGENDLSSLLDAIRAAKETKE
jgi:hypothetical protein